MVIFGRWKRVDDLPGKSTGLGESGPHIENGRLWYDTMPSIVLVDGVTFCGFGNALSEIIPIGVMPNMVVIIFGNLKIILGNDSIWIKLTG